MRINELLNASARPRPTARVGPNEAERVEDGASAGWTRPRPDMSMSRILQELETSQARPAAVHSPTIVASSAPTVPKVASASEPAPASARGRRTRKQSTRSSADTSADTSADPSGATRPRGRLGPLADSDKRVKQRLLVKRSYYRKLDTLTELRGEVEALEHKFQHILRASPARPAPSPGSADALRAQYADLAVAQDALRRENAQLRARAMDQNKMGTRVRILLDEELKDQSAAREALVRIHHTSLPSPPPPPSLPSSPSPPRASSSSISASGLTIRPLTSADCACITSAAVAAVRSFRDAETRPESTGACVFGWRDSRRVDADGRTLRFSLQKTFRGLPAHELARRMWGLVSTARGLTRIYASARFTRFELLQRVDENNVLFYREMRVDGGPPEGADGPTGRVRVFKSLVLASLVDFAVERTAGRAADEAFLVLVRSVDPQTLIVSRAAPDAEEMWTDVFSWGVYESAGSNGGDCRNAFGGFVPTSPAPADERTELRTSGGGLRADTAFWLLLVLVIAVRCESEVVGSPFLLNSAV